MNFPSVLYITVKTQVRRLKYLSISLKYLSHEGLQKQILNEFLLNWSKSNHACFEEYISTSGEITLPEGKAASNSLKAYYHAFKEFNLIIEQGNFVLPTKKGEVLIILLQYLSGPQPSKEINTYTLNLIEKSYFLPVLIEADYDIILSVLQLVDNYPNQRLDSYLSYFPTFYLKRLESKLDKGEGIDVSLVLETTKRVSAWRSPKRYSEELVPPRLNWLIDLDLINLNAGAGTYSLTAKGRYLYERIASSQFERDNFVFDQDFWSSSVISIIGLIYFQENNLRLWENLGEFEREKCTHEALSIASKFFFVFGIPRMPAKSTILLTCLYLLNKHSISANFIEIINWIGQSRNLNGKVYGYRKAAREGEEYIIITNEQ